MQVSLACIFQQDLTKLFVFFRRLSMEKLSGQTAIGVTHGASDIEEQCNGPCVSMDTYIHISLNSSSVVEYDNVNASDSRVSLRMTPSSASCVAPLPW